MLLNFFALAIAIVAYASPFESLSTAAINDPCEPCRPPGATGTTPPAVGTDLSSLYVNVLSSVKGIHFKKKRSVQLRNEGEFCCRQSLDCVKLQSLDIPMCYDKFTTNYAFPDGSHGSLTTGDYHSGSAAANLISGNYTDGNKNGNIYASDPSAKPDMSTLSIPPQFTGTGVGTAIPATELGSIVVYTTVSGTTLTAATVAATTFSEPTTILPHTTGVTQTSVSSSSTSAGAARQGSLDSMSSVSMYILGIVSWGFYVL